MTAELRVSRSFEKKSTKIRITYLDGPGIPIWDVTLFKRGADPRVKKYIKTIPMDQLNGNNYESGTLVAEFPGNKQHDYDVYFGPTNKSNKTVLPSAGPVPTGIYRLFLYTNGNKTVKLQLEALTNDIKFDDLMNKAGLTPPDTASGALTGVVMFTTVLAALLGVAASIATAGTATPVVLTLIAGAAATAGNTAWLFWPTDSDAQWKAIDTAATQAANTTFRTDVASKLQAAQASFNLRVEGIQKVINGMDGSNTTAAQLQSAHADLSTLDITLTEARKLIVNIGETKSGYDPNYPDAFLRYFIEYINIHFRILTAMWMLSDEQNGRTGTKRKEVIDEPKLINAFLAESREYLIKTLRKRQERARAPWGTAKSTVRGLTLWFVSKNGEWQTRQPFYKENDAKAESARLANNDSTACFESDKKSGYLAAFNTLVSSCKQFLPNGISVASIADFEVKL